MLEEHDESCVNGATDGSLHACLFFHKSFDDAAVSSALLPSAHRKRAICYIKKQEAARSPNERCGEEYYAGRDMYTTKQEDKSAALQILPHSCTSDGLDVAKHKHHLI